MRLLLLLSCLLVFQQAIAVQALDLCVESCKKRQAFNLSESTWTAVQASFTPRAKTDQVERQQLARAILLIHGDIDKQMNTMQQNYSADDINNHALSAKDHTRNINEYIAVLLDQQLVNRHFLRKTEQRSILFITEYASSIQSHADGDIYTIFLNAGANETNLIVPLEDWKNAYSINALGNKLEAVQQNNKPESNWDNNFE
jgi:hypothetical protein